MMIQRMREVRKMRRKLGTLTVTVKGTVDYGKAERDVTLTFACYPEEEKSQTSPGCPAEAELQSATFDDTGEVADEFIDPEDYAPEALERAEAMAEDEVDKAVEHEIERRRKPD